MYYYSSFWSYSPSRYLKYAYKKEKINPKTNKKTNPFSSNYEISLYIIEIWNLNFTLVNTEQKNAHLIN